MAIKVVSNAGPLLVLSKINMLYLLKEMYGQVHFPYSVHEETAIEGMDRKYPDAFTLNMFLTRNGWKPERVSTIPADLRAANLDKGEKDAIALAISENAQLLIDEEYGRALARMRGLTLRGSLGVLVECFREKIISESQLRFHFEQISARNDIWISPKLCDRILQTLFP